MVEGLLEGALRIQHDGMKTGFYAKNNEYYPITPKHSHELEFCTGMESKEPWYWVDEDRLVLTMELNEKQLASIEFCNSDRFLAKIDPTVFKNETANETQEVRQFLEIFDPISELINAEGYTKRFKTMETGSGYWLFLTSVNSYMNYFSNFAYLSELCEKHWGSIPEVKGTPLFELNCPLEFAKRLYPGEEFRTHFATLERTLYNDYDSIDNSFKIESILYLASYGLVAVGLLLHYKKVRLSLPSLYLLVGGGNLLFSLPNMIDQSRRFGIDYIAYLQQAGAFFHGERNYTQISSTLGPCFYPAGHLWHYYPVYWLHNTSDDAEKIMTLVFLLVHTALLVMAVAIA
mmetsp:Transcript_13789/g.21539  ORF Transcript_13789/g.21539 Transcript_13789/m.21539 type:complete len:346 (-) Transcript_13789:964-2001(-)